MSRLALIPDKWAPSRHERQRAARRKRRDRRRAVVGALSTVAVLGVLGALVLTSAGWPRFAAQYLDFSYGAQVFPAVLSGLWLNLELVMFGAPLILVLSLVLALLRTSRSPALTPFRLIAVGYVDLFRSVPILLVIYLVGFGVPTLELAGIPIDPAPLGLFAIVISYSGYVAEVIRAGIDSVHPSQRAAARSLGLGNVATMRHVILPQALRRVRPALLNDFVSLIKDTSLISTIGPLDSVRNAQIEASSTFNFTPYMVSALLFLIITVPLTRFTDYVAHRALARQSAQGAT